MKDYDNKRAVFYDKDYNIEIHGTLKYESDEDLHPQPTGDVFGYDAHEVLECLQDMENENIPRNGDDTYSLRRLRTAFFIYDHAELKPKNPILKFFYNIWLVIKILALMFGVFMDMGWMVIRTIFALGICALSVYLMGLILYGLLFVH